MFKNFGLPTRYQWKRIAVNATIYFIGTFVGLLGFQASSGVSLPVIDIPVSTLLAAIASACGSTVKFIWTLLFEPAYKS